MTCALPRCRAEMSINYYGHDVCEKHWQAYCDGTFDLKQKLNIKEYQQQTLR